MKLTINLQNERINLFNILDFKLWELMYELNKDVIETYTCVHQSDTKLEYIFTYVPVSFFPPMYSHMIVHKERTNFKLTMAKDSVLSNYVQLETYNEQINISGTEHHVTIEISFDLNNDVQMLENMIKIMFKKIYQRIKLYVECL
jgi:hypothetical protein